MVALGLYEISECATAGNEMKFWIAVFLIAKFEFDGDYLIQTHPDIENYGFCEHRKIEIFVMS